MLVRLSATDGSWATLKESWKRQCDAYGEDFAQYAPASLSVLEEIVEKPENNTAAYALTAEDGTFHALAYLNRAMLPGTVGWTLRVRHIILAPDYDFGSLTIEQYSDTLSRVLAGTVSLARGTLKADHVKLHLGSPADQQFFKVLEGPLGELAHFSAVKMQGAWLTMTLAEGSA